MRIIGGEHGGRKFNPPNNMPYTRPTTDIAKEGLFNVLQHNLDFEELKTLDLFGGTGSISYELASRGVADLTIVEKDIAMYEFIKKTSTALRIENLKAVKMDVFKFINQCTDKLLNKNGWFVLEHTPRNDYKTFPFYKSERNYGTTIFSTFIESREL